MSIGTTAIAEAAVASPADTQPAAKVPGKRRTLAKPDEPTAPEPL
jgi:hypothetical protein